MWLTSLCALFSLVNRAVNIALPAFAAERRAAARARRRCCCMGTRRCGSISLVSTALSSKPAARRYSGRMMVQTDRRTDTGRLSYRQTGPMLDRFINPAPHTVGSAKNARYVLLPSQDRKKMLTTPQLLSIFDTSYSSYSLMI